ncbi:Methyltransferase domain-containing protein [Halogranum gelatinilyticum]|uniref:Methyltransferase domain-containing protein n=1 Tax=Halogranum gelatinilyticum TaxID=660521 RepID=A0A1G9QCD6_9EURY|nr:methyltransferase domain-containing protein [Halogranum gelatinilyticum]SDM08391.1 Methyltransferase domain-containing protein [Halogranum gelatinilyticum]
MTDGEGDHREATDAAAADGVAATQSFYSRWAQLYDALASHTPGIGGLRARAADRLQLSTGDTVVEMGCGTGANFSYLRERVGPEGAVVGVDLTPGMLGPARARINRAGWANVHVVAGDATRPPVTDADAVFASFVSGMLGEPATVVDDWADLVGPGGRVGLLDLARSTSTLGRPVNALFAGLVFAGLPSKRPADALAAPRTLDARVVAAQRALRDRCRDVTYSTHALGFARLAAGTVK